MGSIPRIRSRHFRRGSGFPLPEDLAHTALQSLLSTYGESSLRDRSIGLLYSLAYRTLHNRVLDEVKRCREVLWRAASGEGVPEPASPAATPEQMAVMAAFAGCLSVAGGLFASATSDTPAGPSVVVVAKMLFFLTLWPDNRASQGV